MIEPKEGQHRSRPSGYGEKGIAQLRGGLARRARAGQKEGDGRFRPSPLTGTGAAQRPRERGEEERLEPMLRSKDEPDRPLEMLGLRLMPELDRPLEMLGLLSMPPEKLRGATDGRLGAS